MHNNLTVTDRLCHPFKTLGILFIEPPILSISARRNNVGFKILTFKYFYSRAITDHKTLYFLPALRRWKIKIIQPVTVWRRGRRHKQLTVEAI